MIGKFLEIISVKDFLKYIKGKKVWISVYQPGGKGHVLNTDMICYKISDESFPGCNCFCFYNNETEMSIFQKCKEVQKLATRAGKDICYKMIFDETYVCIWENIPDFKMKKKF